MADYVQIRFESKKIDEAIGQTEHNTRTIAPSYLRTNEAHNKETNTIYIFENGGAARYDLDNRKKQLTTNAIIKKQLKEILKHNKENNKNFREKKHSVVQDSIITLSNSINGMYANGLITKEQLNKKFLENIKALEKELGIKAINVAIHYDEKTPHCHFMFETYNAGKSIANDLKRKFVKAQDLCGSVWNDLGFQRGEKKEKTNARHMKVVEMHQKEIEQLKGQKKEVETQIKKVEAFAKKQAQNVIEKNKGFFGVNVETLQVSIEKMLKNALLTKTQLQDLKDLKNEVATLNTQLKTLQETLQAQAQAQQVELDTLKTQFKDFSKTQQEKIASMFKQNSLLEQENKKQGQTITQLQNELKMVNNSLKNNNFLEQLIQQNLEQEKTKQHTFER